jgi:SAM-dependent methyltransferase
VSGENQADDFRTLLLGCGYQRRRLLGENPAEDADALPWKGLVTVDIDPACNPDFVCDLNLTPWRFKDNSFDEIHAYEVLEYIGKQGNVHTFFDTFNEIYRILKPNGLLFATTASKFNNWLWADPGRRRAILPESLTFLDRKRWNKVAKTGHSISDYRAFSHCDYEILAADDNHVFNIFCLQAIKPMRQWEVLK